MDVRRITAWCLIVLLHAGLFHALNNGLARHVSVVIPNVVMAFMLPTEQKLVEQAEPPKPTPLPKKIVPPTEVKRRPRQPEIEARPETMREAAPAPMVYSGSTPSRESAPEPSPPAPAEPVAAAPAPPAPPAPPRTVSGVEYLQPPRPEYPPSSRRNGEQGVVQLRVLINAQGRAERIEILKSSDFPRLDEAARQAVMRAVFKPYLENGRPLPVYVQMPIRFHLD